MTDPYQMLSMVRWMLSFAPGAHGPVVRPHDGKRGFVVIVPNGCGHFFQIGEGQPEFEVGFWAKQFYEHEHASVKFLSERDIEGIRNELVRLGMDK